jgi:uncharacterized protein YxeA
MAISKQNRVIGVVAIIFLSVTGVSFYKYKKTILDGAFPALQEQTSSESSIDAKEGVDSASLGNRLDTELQKNSEIKKSNHQVFLQIAGDLSECMAIKIEISEKEQSHLEALIEGFSITLGNPMSQADRWNSWRVKTLDDRDREYRLEVIESDAGQVTRELHAYAFDQSGEQIPMELDSSKTQNPSEDYLREILNEGEVISKNRAGSVSFSTGERLDFVENNGELSEIEFTKMNQIFRCNTIKERGTCQCLN